MDPGQGLGHTAGAFSIRCYVWIGDQVPSDEERRSRMNMLPGMHPRDWIQKPATFRMYSNPKDAFRWLLDLVRKARIEDLPLDLVRDNILLGHDVSRWHRLEDGRWLTFSVLGVTDAVQVEKAMEMGLRDPQEMG